VGKAAYSILHHRINLYKTLSDFDADFDGKFNNSKILGYITSSELYQAFNNKLLLDLDDKENLSMQDYFRKMSAKVNVKDFSKNFVNQMSLLSK